MSFVIREIQPEDNPQIAAIIRQVLTEFGANRPGFAWADPELDQLSQAYQDSEGSYYVVTAADQIIGGGGIAPFPCDFPDICELQKMYLVPAYRGQGIGQALMEKLLTMAQGQGYQGCYLETFGTMAAAIHLYQKFGFHPVEHPIGNSGHRSCNLFFMRHFESPEAS